MVQSSNESQQTRTFSIDHENVLPDHYRLIELIGRGGMAEVYLAEDRRLGRKVGIKFLNPEFRRDQDRVRRFRQEARAASALNHPNILTIHDIGDSGGIQFIVSEFVEGETIGTRIAQGKLPFTEAIDIAIQAASALSAAHAAGIVHRDIKPDNVMIRNDGVVKVLDFGLAKARGFSTANGAEFDAMTLDSGSTSPGLIVGTPQYMSPEQARGKELDGRTDIFSLGIIIFEMITRHSPFASGSFADTMAAILTKEPRRVEEFVEDAPPRLIALIDKCLKKQRDERFASMAEVETELKLLRGELINSPRGTVEVDPVRSDHTQIRPTDAHSIRRFVSDTFRRPSPAAAVIILLSAGLLVGGWWVWDRASRRSSASPALMRTVPVTSWSSSASELVTAASFSPDGKMIAFSARKGDATEIWVKPVVGGDSVQVTKNGGYNQYPIWSPDGAEILFVSDRGNEWNLWKTPFTGGTVTMVAGIGLTDRPVLWGKTRHIYYQSKGELYRISELDHNVERITSFSDQGVVPLTIEISADERSLAFSVPEEGVWKIKVKSLDSGLEKVVAESGDQIDHIAWAPNGKSIFSSLFVERSLQIFESSIDQTTAVQRSNGDTNFLVHDVADTGAVLYGSVSETSDLWKLEVEGSRESIVSNEVALEFWPDVAANGSIVFQSSGNIEQPFSTVIKVVEPNTAVMRSIAPSGSLPAWSNNGEWLAFIRKGESSYEIWKTRVDGTGLARLSEIPAELPFIYMTPYLTAAVSHIAWSPDDSKIAFVAKVDGRSRLWIVPTEGGSHGNPLNHKAIGDAVRSPIWTRDGYSVIFLAMSGRNEDRIYQIYETELASGQARLLLEVPFPIRLLGLLPEGRELIFAARSDRSQKTPTPSISEIRSLSLASGQTRTITTLENAYFYNTHLAGEVLGYVTRQNDVTKIATFDLRDRSGKAHVLINDPKILISTLGMSPDGSYFLFGKQTRTNLLSMLTN
jgi:serine/threonine protein kinase